MNNIYAPLLLQNPLQLKEKLLKAEFTDPSPLTFSGRQRQIA